MSATMTSMVAAAPAMTSMYAQPTYSNYGAAAPTMTSMYATPGASMYMPSTTIAAPAVVETVAAAPTMVAPSYVAQPQMVTVAAPQQAVTEVVTPAFAMPAPTKLTQGMTEPAVLEKEKVAYGQALEKQLKKQSDAVLEEASIKKKMLEQQAQTQRAQFELQIEEQLKMSCLQVDQEANQQCIGLREAAITQQTSVEEQCAIKVADFTKKKCLEDFSVKSWELQKQWFEKETAFTQQYQAVMQKGSKAVVTQMPAVQTVAAPTTMNYGISTMATAAPVNYAAAPVSYAAAPVSYGAAPITTLGTTTMAAPTTVVYG